MDVFRTIRFGLAMAIRGVDEVSSNIFSPYPGSEFFNELQAASRIELTDDYFLSLTSLNSDYARLNPLTFNESMGPRELAVYRVSLLILAYSLSYLCYPWRIVRTLRNWWTGKAAATVFESRVRGALLRRFSLGGASDKTAA